MNNKAMQILTQKFYDEARVVTDAIDGAIKNAQDHAYELGFSDGLKHNLAKHLPREKMTEKQIEDIVENLPGGALGYTKTWGWLDLARAVEKAHGIE